MLSSTQKKYQSALVIGNASEVVTGIIKQIAGNDISNSLNGSKITSDIIHTLVAQRLNQQLSKTAA